MSDASGSTEQLTGLTTFTGPTSLNSLRAAKTELLREGVALDLFRVRNEGGRRYWRVPTARRADVACLRAVMARKYDFVLLNPGAGLMRRPVLLKAMLRAARARRLPVLVRWGSCSWIFRVSTEARLKSETMADLRRQLSDPSIHHLVLSPPARDDLVRDMPVSSVSVIRNSCTPPDVSDARQLPDDPPIVLNIASVQPRKGPDLFVDTAREVCAQHPTVTFVWVGGTADRALREQITAYGLSDRVAFVGAAYPPHDWIHRSSLLFFTSRSEAFGLAVAEAMSRHRTVCCFDGTGGFYATGETGIVVAPFDTSEAARQILDVIRRPAAERINDAARRRYDELFAPAPFARDLARTIREVAG